MIIVIVIILKVDILAVFDIKSIFLKLEILLANFRIKDANANCNYFNMEHES